MVSAQLSLFNIGQTVATSYKIGDLVKLRKKPTAASYVKKGDIVEISAIHPVDGSIKFWNERSESWEYVYPDEIRSVVKSTDSPTMAEIAVGESNAPDDSPTIAEVAVGESNAPNDSPTIAEVAVGESNAPNDSPTIAEVAVGESNAPPGDDYLPLDPISTYRPRGTARGGEYYRLSYRSGGKVRQVHIRGGNTDSPIAQAKVQEVRSLLAIGLSPAQVAEMLRQPGKV
jgi:hypothetical protein